MSSTKAKLDEKKCKRAAANKLEELAAIAAAAAAAKKDTDGHTRVYSGEVVCGALHAEPMPTKKRMACRTFAKELRKERRRRNESISTVACGVSCVS